MNALHVGQKPWRAQPPAAEPSLPFSTWSLAKLADFSRQCLRHIDRVTKKARVAHLPLIADGEVMPEDGNDPSRLLS
ncbi:hypothetical protein [Streptomyces chattanoogensis]|uniref:hypothetical protein n=1 Tax=Streptomyces chattanoogensis TaxID=66876 RepID=UPI0036BD3A69